MKKITKLTALVAALSLTLVLAACQNPASDETTKEETKVTQPAPAPVPKTYTVTFNTNGGSTVDSQTVTEGSKASRPADPTKQPPQGYTNRFDGWFTSTDNGTTLSNQVFDFNTTITANLTLYAKWSSIRNEVSGKIGKYGAPYEVGDIVFNDGSATAYTSGLSLNSTQVSSAVAVIFYKGTELNDGNDTSTVRTLGMAIKHSTTSLSWCSDTANSKDISHITTLECQPSQIDDGYQFIDATKHKRNGSNNLEKLGEFLGANDDTTGEGAESRYPGFYYAKNYGTANNLSGAYATGWYLPSAAELYKLWVTRETTNAARLLCNGDTCGTSETIYYFSSTPLYSSSEGKCAYGIRTDAPYVGHWALCGRDKNSNWSGTHFYYACAIREF